MRTRSNRYKNSPRRPRRNTLLHLASKIESVGLFMYVVGLSVFLILVHDVATQTGYFKARSVNVDGNHRLSTAQVLDQARIMPDANILSVNLQAARKRLQAHPWIAEAQLSRKIPDGIEIRITEQKAAAIVDVGRRFLIDEQGTVFKELDREDPKKLPEVVGLRYADLRLGSGPNFTNQPAVADNRNITDTSDRYRLMEAVVSVLKLGNDSASAVPTGEIRQIKVDQQLGVTLLAFDSDIPIKLGFENYSAKYMVLKQIMAMLKRNKVSGINELSAVDLNDINRIIVRPNRETPKQENRAAKS